MTGVKPNKSDAARRAA